MDTEREYLTKEKFEELQKELEVLKTVTRKTVADQLEYARSLGDLSENAEYQEARENQAKIEGRITQLEEILKTAVIISHKSSDVVEVGSEIEIQKAKESDTHTYFLVGSEEADISKNKISNHSPLGVALLGKKKGEEFDFQTPKGKVKYKIVNVK